MLSRRISSVHRRLAAVCILAATALLLPFAIGSVRAAPAPVLPGPWESTWESDAFWSRDFAVPGLDGGVTTIERFGNELVLGGWFTQGDDVVSPFLIRHDGSSWHAMPPGVERPPSAMLVDGGSLIVAGGFVDGNRQYLGDIAAWDGRGDWQPLGRGEIHGQYVRLLRWRGALVAAGRIDLAGQGHPYHLARYSGGHWEPLGPPVDEWTFGVLDAEVFGDRIVLGGYTSGSAEPFTMLSLRADGSGFDTLFTGPQGPHVNSVSRLATHDGRLVIAGGVLDDAGWHALAAWNGTSLTMLDQGVNLTGWITALRSTPEGLLVGGDLRVNNVGTTVARLGREGWETFPGLGGTQVIALAGWGGKVVAGGGHASFVSIGGSLPGPSLLAAVHEGATWRSLGSRDERTTGLDGYWSRPGGAQVEVLATHSGEWFAGGRFELAWTGLGWERAIAVARWDGDHWKPHGGNVQYGRVSALASFQGALHAGGSSLGILQEGLGVVPTSLMRHDDTAWAAVPGSPDGGILALAEYGGRLIVGGVFATAGGHDISGLAAFDGAQWSPLGMPRLAGGFGSPSVVALLVHDGSLYVAGRFDVIGDVPARGIARWDGAQWHALGEGLAGDPRVLAVYDGRIVAAGSLGCPSGFPRCRSGGILLWDGVSWTPLPDAPQGVMSLAVHDRILVAGGSFPGRVAHEGPDARLRAWDGRSWHALGSGVWAGAPMTGPTWVTALAWRDDVLWVGGSFQRMGGVKASLVATWTGLTRKGRSTGPFRGLLAVTPNPSRAGTPVVVDLAAGTPARVAIHDLAGRRLREIEARAEGDRMRAAWDGRDAHGREAPPGVYFARVRVAGRPVATHRLVRLPR